MYNLCQLSGDFLALVLLLLDVVDLRRFVSVFDFLFFAVFFRAFSGAGSFFGSVTSGFRYNSSTVALVSDMSDISIIKSITLSSKIGACRPLIASELFLK